MTKPRKLGNDAREHVNCAAEEITKSNAILQPIIEKPMTREELLVRVSRAMYQIQIALRHLEHIGAETKPQ